MGDILKPSGPTWIWYRCAYLNGVVTLQTSEGFSSDVCFPRKAHARQRVRDEHLLYFQQARDIQPIENTPIAFCGCLLRKLCSRSVHSDGLLNRWYLQCRHTQEYVLGGVLVNWIWLQCCGFPIFYIHSRTKLCSPLCEPKYCQSVVSSLFYTSYCCFSFVCL